jgi:hypothetical protein
MTTPPQHSDEWLDIVLEGVARYGYYRDEDPWGLENSDDYIDIGSAKQTILAELKKREASSQTVINLRADLAQAIGYSQGLGHPNKYLEKRYPDLAQLRKEQQE